MNNTREVITCDIDGILTDYPKCWLNYLKDNCGTLYNTVAEAKMREPKYKMYKDMYRESEYKANLPMNEHNKEVLKCLSENYDIIFATSRPINDGRYPHLKDNTYNWLRKNGLNFKELVFKDIEATFLNDKNIAFHIDDEMKYAEAVSKKMSTKQMYGGRVYLLTDNSEKLPEGITAVKDLSELEPKPFFSVCIPSTKRGETIYRALKSVAEQTYRNFEVCIVDCASKDNTVAEIERFFASEDYKKNPFEYKFEKKDYTPIGTEDWNEPIKLASGKYIAMLEGDDYWLPNHLHDAHSALLKNPNVGIYGSSNLENKRVFEGKLENAKLKAYTYIMKDGAVPPSESIFIRVNKEGKPFFYNSDDYKYSPEIGLYTEIALAGFDLYYSQTQDVYREPSTNQDKFKTWYYFADRFTHINRYSSFFAKKETAKAKRYNGKIVASFSFGTRSIKKAYDLLKNLSKKLGCFTFIICVTCAFFRKIIRLPISIPVRIYRKIKYKKRKK